MQELKLISGVETVEIEKTMTSLELVGLINNVRKQEFELGKSKKLVKIRHVDFMRKVPMVLGKSATAKFFTVAKVAINNGGSKDITIYKFPERESWLMAMSYSYTLQALIYDTLQEAFKSNHELRSIVDNMSALEKRVSLNGSNWGRMGHEQKRNKQLIDKLADTLCDVVQLKLFQEKV